MSVPGVDEYRAISLQSQDDPVTIDMLADVITATVGVDSFTEDVTFNVTSLAAENDVCFAIAKSEFEN